MTNFERYREELLRIAGSGYAPAVKIMNGEICACYGTKCADCVFRTQQGIDCGAAMIQWLYSENAKRVELSEFAKEYLQLLRDNGIIYITRDAPSESSSAGLLWGHRSRPDNLDGNWFSENTVRISPQPTCFGFIRADDETPWSVTDLLKGAGL